MPAAGQQCKALLTFDVGDHAEVAVVAAGADKAIVDGLLDGTLRLVAVGAVGKTAAVQHLPHLRKEMTQLLNIEINHAELFDAGSVDKIG